MDGIGLRLVGVEEVVGSWSKDKCLANFASLVVLKS